MYIPRTKLSYTRSCAWLQYPDMAQVGTVQGYIEQRIGPTLAFSDELPPCPGDSSGTEHVAHATDRHL